MRTRLLTLAIAFAAVLAAGPVMAGCGSAGPHPAPSPPPAGTSPAGTTAPPSAPSASVASSTSSPVPSPEGLVPLWPFTALAQVAAWQAAYRTGGHQPWPLDAGRTALAFSRDHLRYTDVDRVTTRSVAGGDARIGVGWNDGNGTGHTAAVLHLVRFGAGQDAPWVVVGSDDTLLTVSAPRYGATAGSPLTVGGRITGVDESLRVKALGPASATPLAEVTGIPAGGEGAPWTATLRFTAPSGTVLAVAVSTGGHLRAVERFAITAVRAA